MLIGCATAKLSTSQQAIVDSVKLKNGKDFDTCTDGKELLGDSLYKDSTLTVFDSGKEPAILSTMRSKDYAIEEAEGKVNVIGVRRRDVRKMSATSSQTKFPNKYMSALPLIGACHRFAVCSSHTTMV